MRAVVERRMVCAGRVPARLELFPSRGT